MLPLVAVTVAAALEVCHVGSEPGVKAAHSKQYTEGMQKE
jgi:hypothetical protein